MADTKKRKGGAEKERDKIKRLLKDAANELAQQTLTCRPDRVLYQNHLYVTL